MARPSKRTPELEEALLTSLRNGNTLGAACYAAGIVPETFSRWRQSDPALQAAVAAAESEAEARAVAALADAFLKDWRAAAFWLTHRRRQDWHTLRAGEEGAPEPDPGTGELLNLEELTVEEKRILLKALERQMNPEPAPAAAA